MNKRYKLISAGFFYIAAFFMIEVLITATFLAITGLVDKSFDTTVFMVFIGSVLIAKVFWFGGERYMRKIDNPSANKKVQ